MTEQSRPWRKADYLKYFEDFLTRHPNMTAMRLSCGATNSPNFISNMRRDDGPVPRLSTLLNVVDFINDYENGRAQ